MSTPARFASFDIDPLASVNVAEVKGSALRDGMVLVDDLDTPIAGLDHRTGRKGAGIGFLVADLEKGGWYQHSFHANQTFRVVSR